MQLIYGNDGINFRVLDASSSIGRDLEKNFLTYSGYDFVSNSESYSSIANEPEAITYISTNFNRAISDRSIFVSKSGHMRQFGSPSSYFHAYVKEVSPDFYKDQFFEIFNYQFVTDVNARLYQNGSIDSFAFTNVRRQVKALRNDQLLTIIATFLANQQSGEITKILVDAYGDRYNERVRDVLATIYRYLPYEMRRRHGFLSYTKSDKGIAANISFAMFCPSETAQDGTLINLMDAKCEPASTVRSSYKDYANYLVNELNDFEREKHFADLSEIAQNGRLTPEDCLNYYINIGKWRQGTQEQFLPEWIDYIDKNSFRKGPLYYIMLKIIIEKVDNNYYNDYLFNSVLLQQGDTVDRLSTLSAKTLRFADCLDEIFIDPKRFHEWYQRQQNITFSRVNANDPIAVKNAMENEISKLKGINIMSPELDALLAEEMRILSEKCKSLASDIDSRMDQESEMIGRQFASLKHASLTQFISQIGVIRSRIQYPDNLELYKQNVKEWCEENVHPDLSNPAQLAKTEEIYQQFANELPESYYAQYQKAVEDAKLRFRQEAASREYELTKDTLLESYFDIRNKLQSGMLDKNSDIVIKIERKPIRLKTEKMLILLEFMLSPSDQNRGLIIGWFDKLFQLLYENELIHTTHFEYLLRQDNENNVENLLLSYMTCYDVEISGKYAAKCLLDYDAGLAEMLARKFRANYLDSEYTEMSEFIKTVLSKKPSPGRRVKHEPEKKPGLFGFLK